MRCLHALIPTILFLFTIALGGCGFTQITVEGRAQLAMMPLSDAESLPPPLPILTRDSSIVVAYKADDSIRVRCFNRLLTEQWHHDIDIERLDLDDGAPSFSLERILMYQLGDRISVIIIGTDASDSALAIGQLYDAASGRDLGRKSLARTPEARGIDDQSYWVVMAPDSQHLALRIAVPTPRGDSLAQRIAVYDRDLTRTLSGDIPVAPIGDDRPSESIALGTNGATYDIRIEGTDTLGIYELDVRHPERIRSIKIVAHDSASPDAQLKHMTGWFRSDSLLVLVTEKYDGSEMVGMSVATLNLSLFRAEVDRYSSTKAAEKAYLHNDRAFFAVGYRAMRLTDSAAARIIRLHENAWNARRNHVAELLVFAFGKGGDPTWNRTIPRSCDAYYNFDGLMSDISITPRGTLRLLYRNSTGLEVRELRLDDGTDVPDRSDTLLTFGMGAYIHARTFVWTGENEVMFLTGQISGHTEWSLCRMRIP